MAEQQKLYRYRVDKEEAERQGKQQIMHVPGVSDLPISVASVDEAHMSLTGRQALALLRLLERNRIMLEQEAQAERDREFGRGPGASPAELPQKIQKDDPRIGKRAITHDDRPSMDGIVVAILRYSNSAEYLEVTQDTYAQGSSRPGKTTMWVHADDVDIL